MTDRELADRIREAAEALEDVIATGCQAGLHVGIRAQEVRSTSMADHGEMIGITIDMKIWRPV